MRSWSLLALVVGCGPLTQGPAGPPEPTPPSDDPYLAGEPMPGDPYAEPAPPEPAPPEPAPPEPAPPEPAPPPEPVLAAARKPRGPTPSSDAQAFVEAHNRYRARHCAAPLTWSPRLAQVAQRWANTLRDKGCAFGHSGGSYGENLAAGTTGTLDPESVVKMWYDEIARYKFSGGGFSMETGHFTQVVWRASARIGCGRSQCKGMDIWVCEYDPAGNWEGRYRENVLPRGCR